MKIQRFEFSDLRTDWRLEETAFDLFNLLVGVSGVGKTKILESLTRVCRIATESEYNPGQIQWAIAFEQGDQTYRWEGSTELVKDGAFPEEVSLEEPGRPGRATQMAREKIESAAGTLVERDQRTFRFEGKLLPKLKKAASAICLLEDEKSIAPIQDGFRRVLLSKATSASPYRASRSSTADRDARLNRYRQLGSHEDGFRKFKETLALAGLSKISEYAPLAAYYLQEAFPDQFEQLKAVFIDMFSSVEDVQASASNELDSSWTRHELMIREKGSKVWILQPEISSGMLRALVHLIELTLAPRGSVIVIDEFENSLGINCMPQLTDFILSRASDLQFIITSHHPYVINKIPPETWKLVTRKGGCVRVISAKDIPSLQKISHQQAFIRLINLPEFEEGIA